MSSPAYLRSQHARHGEAQRMVRLWFEQEFGTGAAPVDAAGRIIAERSERKPAMAAAGACPVAVRAHARDGGKARGAGALPREAGVASVAAPAVRD